MLDLDAWQGRKEGMKCCAERTLGRRMEVESACVRQRAYARQMPTHTADRVARLSRKAYDGLCRGENNLRTHVACFCLEPGGWWSR